MLLNTGARVGEVVETYNGYKDAYSLIKNIFRKDTSPDLNEELRLSDYILVSVSMTKIFDKYGIDIQQLTEVKLIHRTKTKIGALRLYAVQNEDYS